VALRGLVGKSHTLGVADHADIPDVGNAGEIGRQRWNAATAAVHPVVMTVSGLMSED
jgi:hypothetical protein